MNASLPGQHKCTEHLAVDRTFLAWVRTSIALISLGFVVAKFGVWLRSLLTRLEPQLRGDNTELSLPMGIGLMAFGGILVVLAAWHCHAIHRAIERGEMHSSGSLTATVTITIVVLAVLMIAYMLWTSSNV